MSIEPVFWSLGSRKKMLEETFFPVYKWSISCYHFEWVITYQFSISLFKVQFQSKLLGKILNTCSHLKRFLGSHLLAVGANKLIFFRRSCKLQTHQKVQKLNWKKIAEWNIFEKYRQTNGCLWKWFWKGSFLALPYYGHYMPEFRPRLKTDYLF